jgi:hypothetical protein
MPTNRTRRPRIRKGLNCWKIDQLITGEFLIAGVGYAEMHAHGCNHWSLEQWHELHEAIRADWQMIGSDFLAWWRGETERYTAIYASIGGRCRDPATEPWALAEFGVPA